MNKKLSIITINYNNLDGLKRTVKSVLNQTWQEFEHIIIDGGSTDGSAEYIESQSDHFDFWVSEKDSGIYNAMNKGIKVATGEYLLFLNSGDHLFNDEVLDKNHCFIKEKDLIYFNLQVIDCTNTYTKSYPKNLIFSYFLKDTLPHPATFIRKVLFEKQGLYDESFKIVSDWKFFIESVCKFNVSYVGVEEILTVFCLDGISSKEENLELIKKEKQQILNSVFLAYLDDISELNYLKSIIFNLKKSRKFRFLINIGLIKKI